MKSRRRPASVVPVVLFVLCALHPVRAADDGAASLTPSQRAEFLRTAKVIASKDLSKGVTKPKRLTLTDGAVTHDAVFQAINQSKPIQRFPGGKVELNFRDSFQFNIAAYRLAEVLGLDHMVPVTVERMHEGQRGSLAWWINWKWDEQSRQAENVRPPDPIDWAKQHAHMRVFGELVHDTDRNMGNILITEDWQLWMVDFTRAFRLQNDLFRPENVQRCSYQLLERLKALSEPQVAEATSPYLTGAEIKALLKRRDKIVQRLDQLAQQRGDNLVFF